MAWLGRVVLAALCLTAACLVSVAWHQGPVALFGWPSQSYFEGSPYQGGGLYMRPQQTLYQTPLRTRLNAPWPAVRDRMPQPMFWGGWGAQQGQEGVYLVPAWQQQEQGLRQTEEQEPAMPQMPQGQEAREQQQEPAADEVARGGEPGASVESRGEGVVESHDEALASRLTDPQDREEAAWLLREDAAGHRLAALAALRRQRQGISESQLKEEDRKLGDRLQKGKELERTAKVELRQYHSDLAAEEAWSRRQVQYLRATHNYAAMAQREMADAAETDKHSQELVAQSEQVLRAAHLAEVKARVTKNARELAAARASVGRDLEAVRGAEQGMARATAEKKTAAYNTYMSRVLNRVRSKGSRPTETVGDLAKLGEQAHKDVARARGIIGGVEGEKARIERLLSSDRFEDRIRKVVQGASKHSEETLGDMAAIEGDQVRLGKEQRVAKGLSARAGRLDAAARRAEREAVQAAQGA